MTEFLTKSIYYVYGLLGNFSFLTPVDQSALVVSPSNKQSSLSFVELGNFFFVVVYLYMSQKIKLS